MKILKTTVVLTFFILCTTSSFAQTNIFKERPVLTDEEEVSATVTKEIDEVFKADDFTKRKIKNIPMSKEPWLLTLG